MGWAPRLLSILGVRSRALVVTSSVLLLTSACGSTSSSPAMGNAGAGNSSTAGSSAGSGGHAATMGSGGQSASAGSDVAGDTSANTAGTGTAGTSTGCFIGDIDIPTATLNGAIKVGGSTVSVDYGTLTLHNGSDLVTLGSTDDGAYSLHALPGTYDVVFLGKQNSVQLTLKTGLTVAASQTTTFDIDVPSEATQLPVGVPDSVMVTLQGQFTVNGVAPVTSYLPLRIGPLGQSNNGMVFAQVDGGRYQGLAVPGAYDISYFRDASAMGLPDNDAPVARAGVIVTTADPNTVDIDVVSTAVSGNVTVDGVPPDNSAGTFSLNSPSLGRVRILPDASGSYSLHVIPGTYDVTYSGAPDQAAGPKNSLASVKRGVVVAASDTTGLNFSVSSVAVSGKITIDGALVPSDSDYGTLYLRRDGGDQIELGTTSQGTYSTRVDPGSYDVYYEVGDKLQTTLAPPNPRSRIKAGVVFPAGDPITFDIDVGTAVISGSLKIGGALIDKEYDGGRIWLQSSGSDTVRFPLAWTSTGKYSMHVARGTYDVLFEGTAPSALAPHNSLGKAGCLVVP